MAEVATATAVSAFLTPTIVALAIFLGLVLAGVGYLFQSGVFRHIEVETKAGPYGEMTVAYKTGKGPYKDAWQVHAEVSEILAEVKGDVNRQEDASTDNTITTPHLGIYYDDPESVPEEELRYAVGAVLAVTDSTDLDPRQLEALVSAGFKVAVLPKQQYAVVSSFPLKTSLSLYVAIFRVYPRLRNYIAQMSLCAYPAIEICNTTRMDFMMPLSRQEEFFVPEFSEEQVSIATTEMSTREHPDHSALSDSLNETDSVRTSSRTSNHRKSEDRNISECATTTAQPLSNNALPAATAAANMSFDESDIFVKPTKPAPKRAVKATTKGSGVGNKTSSGQIPLLNETPEEVKDTLSCLGQPQGDSLSDESEDDTSK